MGAFTTAPFAGPSRNTFGARLQGALRGLSPARQQFPGLTGAAFGGFGGQGPFFNPSFGSDPLTGGLAGVSRFGGENLLSQIPLFNAFRPQRPEGGANPLSQIGLFGAFRPQRPEFGGSAVAPAQVSPQQARNQAAVNALVAQNREQFRRSGLTPQQAALEEQRRRAAAGPTTFSSTVARQPARGGGRPSLRRPGFRKFAGNHPHILPTR